MTSTFFVIVDFSVYHEVLVLFLNHRFFLMVQGGLSPPPTLLRGPTTKKNLMCVFSILPLLLSVLSDFLIGIFLGPEGGLVGFVSRVFSSGPTKIDIFQY